MKTPVETLLEHKGHKVHTVHRGDTTADAVQVMNERHIGSLVVIDDDTRPVGMFTERDVLTRVVAAHRDPFTTLVAEVLTPGLVSIALETTVEKAMRIVTEKRCRHLPVIADGRLAGLISIGDLTRWLIREQKHQITDLMDYITAR